MRKLFLLFLLISAFAFAQMPNVSRVWLNNSQFYSGTIGNSNTPLKLKILLSQQDRKNDQEYFVSGISVVERNLSNFEGKLKITKYKGGKKLNTVFGEFDFAEEPTGKHSGTFKGKFVYTFKWNRKSETVESQYLEFIGNWTSYDGTLTYKTNWKNQ
jgi:hypothetical protein